MNCRSHFEMVDALKWRFIRNIFRLIQDSFIIEYSVIGKLRFASCRARIEIHNTEVLPIPSLKSQPKRNRR